MHERSEIRLDRVLGVWLTLGGLCAMGLMFALGVTVGRKQALAQQTVEPARDPLAQLDHEKDVHDELTFYSRLTEGEGKAKRKPVVETKTEEPRTEEAKVESRGPKTEDRGPKTEDQEPRIEAAQPAGTVTGGLAAGPAKTGEYTVQVSSFQTQEEANAYAASLQRKGYKPFVVSASLAGKGTWYRVRLGAFPSEDQAVLAKLQLASADIPAWVLRSE